MLYASIGGAGVCAGGMIFWMLNQVNNLNRSAERRRKAQKRSTTDWS